MIRCGSVPASVVLRIVFLLYRLINVPQTRTLLQLKLAANSYSLNMLTLGPSSVTTWSGILKRKKWRLSFVIMVHDHCLCV